MDIRVFQVVTPVVATLTFKEKTAEQFRNRVAEVIWQVDPERRLHGG